MKSYFENKVIFDVVQSDDLEGEIDMASCVDVSDCYVEKNYGLQIHVCAYCPADCDVLMNILITSYLFPV